MVNIKRLNIFIDESGDFGVIDGSSDLYAVSFVLHESTYSIQNELAYLNQKLSHLNYFDMIHTAYLISRKGDYAYFDLEKRRSLFWALFYFANKVKIRIRTVIVNKKYLNKRGQLKSALEKGIEDFLNDNKDYLSSFDRVVVYYDDGQKILSTILNSFFSNFTNVERRHTFNHTEKRLFQVADMLTVIDKLEYKYRYKIPFTNAEKYFFDTKDILDTQKKLVYKRI